MDHEQSGDIEAGTARGSGSGDDGFLAFVAESLAARQHELVAAWSRRGAGAVGGSRRGEAPDAGAGTAEGSVEEIVRTVIAAARGCRWHEPVMRAGWATGTGAFWRGASLYQVLKELDGGVSLLLSAADAATREFTGAASASDGLMLARRISDGASLLRLAAAGGYTRAMSDELRQRYRTIRHDLRNPLGTIATAVAMMDDESLPEETRQNPRMRAMLARNTRSMEAMIASTLGDSAARLPAIPVQTTSLHALACAVRGDLSVAVDGVEVVVAPELPTFPFDSTGLELLLKAVVLAIARQSEEGVQVMIDLAAATPRSATLALFRVAGSAGDLGPLDLAFARELVARLGGRVVVDDAQRVLVEVPLEPLTGDRTGDRVAGRAGDGPADRAPERTADRRGDGLGDRGSANEVGDRPAEASPREPRRDLGGDGERANRETRAL